jgi:8-oxo-dGTP pyrophosphatase MutT (NUDIX family)
MADLPPPIPAATLILMRQPDAGPPELLMMERSGHMAFAAGALVFPGGRIEEQDAAAAQALAEGSDAASAKIAAIRETLEETGIAAGLDPAADPDQTAWLRERLLDGAPSHRCSAKRGWVSTWRLWCRSPAGAPISRRPGGSTPCSSWLAQPATRPRPRPSRGKRRASSGRVPLKRSPKSMRDGRM